MTSGLLALLARVAADENLHMLFGRNPCTRLNIQATRFEERRARSPKRLTVKA